MARKKIIKRVLLYKPNTIEGYIEIQRQRRKFHKYYYRSMSFASVARLDRVLFEMTIKK